MDRRAWHICAEQAQRSSVFSNPFFLSFRGSYSLSSSFHFILRPQCGYCFLRFIPHLKGNTHRFLITSRANGFFRFRSGCTLLDKTAFWLPPSFFPS